MPGARHIGIDIAQTCPQRAGCGWYAGALAEALIAAAPERTFSLYHHFGGFINTATDSGFRSTATNAIAPLFGMSALEAKGWWQRIESGQQPLPGAPEIVHATSFHAPRIPHTKQVFTVYDVSFWAVPQYTTETNRLLCQRETLAALQNADAFVFISKSSHAEFEAMLPGWLQDSGKPWRVIYPGLRLPVEAAPASRNNHGCWLFVGSLEPRKNVPLLLDAFEMYWRASPRPRRLELVGGVGWLSDSIRARITHLSASGKALHHGYVPDDKLIELYRSSHALICPSWYEGFGLPVLEAMGNGLPVLCSRTTSLPEVAGNAALYFDPTSARGLADLMLRLEAEPLLHRDLSERSVAQARRFTWAETATQTLAFYEEVLDSSPASPRSGLTDS